MSVLKMAKPKASSLKAAATTPDSDFDELPAFPTPSRQRPTVESHNLPEKSFLNVVHAEEKIKFASNNRKGRHIILVARA